MAVGIDTVSLKDLVVFKPEALESLLNKILEAIANSNDRLKAVEASQSHETDSQKQVSSLQEQVAALTARLGNVESAKSAEAEKRADKLQAMDQLNEQLTAMLANGSQVQDQMASMAAQATEQSKKIAELQSVLSNLPKMLEDAEARIRAEIRDEVVAYVDNKISSLKDDIDADQKEFAGKIEKSVKTFDQKLSGIKDAMAEVDSTMEKHKDALDVIQQQVTKLAKLEPVTHSHSDAIASHTDAISELSTKLDGLELDASSYIVDSERDKNYNIGLASGRTSPKQNIGFEAALEALRIDLQRQLDQLQAQSLADARSPINSNDSHQYADCLIAKSGHQYAYAAGSTQCISCAQARSPSPTRFFRGTEGRVYNYIPKEDRAPGAVHLGPIDVPTRGNRSLSASHEAIIKRNPHPSVQFKSHERHGADSSGRSMSNRLLSASNRRTKSRSACLQGTLETSESTSFLDKIDASPHLTSSSFEDLLLEPSNSLLGAVPCK